MAAPKSKVFSVRASGLTRFILDGETASMRLVRAKTLTQVNAHVAKDLVIEVATPDDLHAAGKQDIDIENAED